MSTLDEAIISLTFTSGFATGIKDGTFKFAVSVPSLVPSLTMSTLGGSSGTGESLQVLSVTFCLSLLLFLSSLLRKGDDVTATLLRLLWRKVPQGNSRERLLDGLSMYTKHFNSIDVYRYSFTCVHMVSNRPFWCFLARHQDIQIYNRHRLHSYLTLGSLGHYNPYGTESIPKRNLISSVSRSREIDWMTGTETRRITKTVDSTRYREMPRAIVTRNASSAGSWEGADSRYWWDME